MRRRLVAAVGGQGRCPRPGVDPCGGARGYSMVFSTSRSVPTISSIWARSTISGGLRAMRSPEARTPTPLSKQARKASKARLVGVPGNGSSSMPATSPILRHVDHVAGVVEAVYRLLPVGLESAARANRPSAW